MSASHSGQVAIRLLGASRPHDGLAMESEDVPESAAGAIAIRVRIIAISSAPQIRNAARANDTRRRCSDSVSHGRCFDQCQDRGGRRRYGVRPRSLSGRARDRGTQSDPGQERRGAADARARGSRAHRSDRARSPAAGRAGRRAGPLDPETGRRPAADSDLQRHDRERRRGPRSRARCGVAVT